MLLNIFSLTQETVGFLFYLSSCQQRSGRVQSTGFSCSAKRTLTLHLLCYFGCVKRGDFPSHLHYLDWKCKSAAIHLQETCRSDLQVLLPWTRMLCLGAGAAFTPAGMCGHVHELQAAIHVLVMPQCFPTALPGGQTTSPQLILLTGQDPETLNTLKSGLHFQMQRRTQSFPFRNIHTSLCALHLRLTSGVYLEQCLD